MSDRVLQHVLEDLRPRIMPKLNAEANVMNGTGSTSSNATKGSVDVHRGDTYQFAYFFRKAESHSVLTKTRDFVVDSNSPRPIVSVPSESRPQSKKRKIRSSSKTSTKKRPAKILTAEEGARERSQTDDEFYARDEGREFSVSEDEPSAVHPRRSSRRRKVINDYREDDEEDSDIPMEDLQFGLSVDSGHDSRPGRGSKQEETGVTAGPSGNLELDAESGHNPSDTVTVKDEPSDPDIVLMPGTDARVDDAMVPQTTMHIEIEDDEEPKPKLALRLQYQGFSIPERCLCVVVEPWPAMRLTSRALAVAPASSTRAPSVLPEPAAGRRAQTPLFLPDFDREKSVTPGPSRLSNLLPPVPLFDDSERTGKTEMGTDYDDSTGLMEFSQHLTWTGDLAGAMEDDDEFDGAVLFADADEVREL